MNDLDDLVWLAAAQPDVAPPEPVLTRRTRRVLDRRIQGRPLPALAPAVAAAPRRERRWQRPATVLALAGTMAAVVVAGVAVGRHGSTAPHGLVAGASAGTGSGSTGASHAAAPPLVALASRVLAEPAPTGDATLIHRVQHYPDRTSYSFFDLYADGGSYFGGQTPAEVRSSIRDGADFYDGSATMRRQLDAAIAATTLAPDAARRRFIAATWANGHGPARQAPQSVPTPAAGASPAAVRKLDAMKQAAERYRRASPAEKRRLDRSADDNRIWMAALDTLQAGAGRRVVRAGILRLLATMSHVVVERHGATLVLRNTDFSDHYVEALTIDAATGIPSRLVGGTAGKQPSVVVTYDISRVTVKSLETR